VDFRYSLVGLLIGFLVGLTGMGGGSLLAPILILVFKVPPVWAVGTDVTYSTVTKAFGSIVHIRQKNVNFKIALWLACGSVPATLLSVTLVQYIRKHYGSQVNGIVLHAIGFTLILVAILLVAKPFIMRRLDRRRIEEQKQAALEGKPVEQTNAPTPWEKRYRPLVTALVGAFVGFLVFRIVDGAVSGRTINAVQAILFLFITVSMGVLGAYIGFRQHHGQGSPV